MTQMNHVHLSWIHSSNIHLIDSTPAPGKGMINPVVEFWHSSEKPAVIIPKAILLFEVTENRTIKGLSFHLFFFQSISLNRVPHTGLELETLHVLASRIAKVVGKLHHAWFQTFFIFAVYVCVESQEHLQMFLGCHPQFPFNLKFFYLFL